MLYQYGMRLMNNHNLVEEAIQELFVELLSYNNQLEQVENIKAYLIVAFRKKLFKLLKKEQSFQKDIKVLDFAEIAFSAEDFIINEEEDTAQKHRLLEAINNLPKRQKELVYLKYFSGLDNKEISTVMKISYQGVLNMLSKAMKKLRLSKFLRMF